MMQQLKARQEDSAPVLYCQVLLFSCLDNKRNLLIYDLLLSTSF